jgi:ketosteroid isomerase-like protein
LLLNAYTLLFISHFSGNLMMRRTPLEAVEQLDKAFNQGNLDEVLDFYEKDASIVLEPGKIKQGHIALREAFSHAIALKGKAMQLKTNVIESHDIALFTSKWIFNWISADGKPLQRESYATTVFRKNDNGEWLIVIDNSFGPAVLGY